MAALSEVQISSHEVMSRTEMVLKTFISGLGKVELTNLLGRDFSKLTMTIDRTNPNLLNFRYTDPRNNNVLMNIQANTDEQNLYDFNRLRISVDFVHKFLDGTHRGFRLLYHPFERDKLDDCALSEIQILPKQGEYLFPWSQYKMKDRDKPNVLDFPRIEKMIYIELIEPDMTTPNLHSFVPYSLKYNQGEDYHKVRLVAEKDNKYCKDPFEITLPAHIGLSKEALKDTLEHVQKIQS